MISLELEELANSGDDSAFSIESSRQIAKREYNNLMCMEENQNYPIEELICLVGILVKCDDISRETLTSKAAGIALAMENSLPSQDIGSEMREQVAEAEQRSLAREGIKTAEQF